MDRLNLDPADNGRITCPEVVCHSPESVRGPEPRITDLPSVECHLTPLTDCHMSRSLDRFDMVDDVDNTLKTSPSQRFLSVPQIGLPNVGTCSLYACISLILSYPNMQYTILCMCIVSAIGLYRDVWIAAIASSRSRLATLTGAMCKTSQCGLRSLRVNSGMLNVIRIVTYYTLPPLESPTSTWIAMAFWR